MHFEKILHTSAFHHGVWCQRGFLALKQNTGWDSQVWVEEVSSCFYLLDVCSCHSYGFYFFLHFTWNNIISSLSGFKRWLPFCSEYTKQIQLLCLLLSNRAGLPRRISLCCQILVPFLIIDQGESLLVRGRAGNQETWEIKKKLTAPVLSKTFT